MTHRRRCTALALLGVAFYAATARAAAAAEYAFHHEYVMGTALELRVSAGSPAAAAEAETRVLAEIDRLSAIFSGYDPSSEFRRWAATSGAAVRVSAELFEVLEAADRWRERSGGAFDPRVEALSALWAASAARGREPSDAELAEARRLMSTPAWTLDPLARTAARRSACPLTLNAIAKGYIVGRASAAGMGAAGVTGLLLNVGGDMRACGEGERMIGVAPPVGDSETTEPFTHLAVRDRAVATSGSSQRGYRVGGRWFSHVIDPRTGRPASRVAAATVVAADPAGADALATALNVLPPAEGLALARSAGAECLLVTADGRVERSGGFARYEKTQSTPADPPAQAADRGPAKGAWNNDFEMVVNFELNSATGSRGFRRQYVAIWVEAREGFPVRTLLIWGRGRWVTDLKLWTQGDQERRLVDDTDLRAAVARPTRPPGKYDVIWDGKDDHGAPVAAGEYTVFIEAAREHGTYQNIRKQVTLADRPFAEELKGNVEIKSASIGYRRKGQGK